MKDAELRLRVFGMEQDMRRRHAYLIKQIETFKSSDPNLHKTFETLAKPYLEWADYIRDEILGRIQ